MGVEKFSTNRDTAVILGAGASAAFGYPTTAKLLPGIAKLLRGEPFGHGKDDKAAVNKLKMALSALLPTWEEDLPHQPLITDILSILDQATLVGNIVIQNMGQTDCAEVRHLLDRALVQVIDEVFDEEEEFSPICHAFVDWVMTNVAGVVTTNYDLEFDMALVGRLDLDKIPVSFDFGFSWRDPFESVLHHSPLTLCFTSTSCTAHLTG